MRHVWIWLFLLLPITGFSFNCQQLNGLWQGQYHDTQGLFPNRTFPVNLMLQYQAPYLYGYTLPAKDQTGAQYGMQAPAVFWATCKDHQVSDLYLLLSNDKCGAAQDKPNLTLAHGVLSFNTHWENAMIDTTFYFSLKRATIALSLNKQWIKHAEAASHTPLPTCH